MSVGLLAVQLQYGLYVGHLSKWFVFVLLFKFCSVVCRWNGRPTIGYNVLGLCEEAELEAQMFNLAQMFIRIPNVQFSTEPAFLQNPC